MKFFDSKYRLFGVINVIDLVVILAVLALGFGVYKVLTPKSNSSKAAALKTATFDIQCLNIRGFTPDQLKVGDKIFKNTGPEMGVVESITVTPAIGEVWDQNNHKMVQYQSLILQDIIIHCRAQGTPTPTGFAVGQLLLHSGAPTPVMTSTFDCDTSYLGNLQIQGQ